MDVKTKLQMIWRLRRAIIAMEKSAHRNKHYLRNSNLPARRLVAAPELARE